MLPFFFFLLFVFHFFPLSLFKNFGKKYCCTASFLFRLSAWHLLSSSSSWHISSICLLSVALLWGCIWKLFLSYTANREFLEEFQERSHPEHPCPLCRSRILAVCTTFPGDIFLRFSQWGCILDSSFTILRGQVGLGRQLLLCSKARW